MDAPQIGWLQFLLFPFLACSLDLVVTRFSWLHLTDLHFGNRYQGPLWPNVQQVFFEDLKRLHNVTGPWNVVLFSGDLVNKGTSDEFARLDAEVLSPLWDHMKSLGSTPHLLAVPGNHDLIRPDVTSKSASHCRLLSPDKFHEIADEIFENPDCEYRKILDDIFAGYRNWWSSCKLRHPDVQPGLMPGDFSVSLDIGAGHRVGVVGMNSTFLQLASGDFKGRLAIDVRQFLAATTGQLDGDGPAWIRKHSVCLLMTHHGPDWLMPSSTGYAEINPAGRFVVHLFGHMHENAMAGNTSGGGKVRRTWQGNSLFGLEKHGDPPKADRRHGYSAGTIRFDTNGSTLRCWPRTARNDEVNGWRIIPDHDRCVLDSDEGTSPEECERTENGLWLRPHVKLGVAVLLVILLAATTIGAWRFVEWRDLGWNSLVDSYLGAPAANAVFYLERFESNAPFGLIRLEREFLADSKPTSHRRRAAYALLSMQSHRSMELEFLLDSLPLIPRDEGQLLIHALSAVHRNTPLDVELSSRIVETTSPLVLNRILAVQLSLGLTDTAADVCKLRDDPTTRTSFIVSYKDFPGDVSRVASSLATIESADLRSALCAAIGQLAPDEAEPATDILKLLFLDAPEGGTHSAAEWALRQQGWTREQLVKLEAAREVDESSIRNWHINSRGMTMVSIPSNHFALGSITDYRDPDIYTEPEAFEPFWISDREVTIRQFYEVRQDITASDRAEHMLTPELPICIDWVEAVLFCNELSKAENLEPFYHLEKDERGKDGFVWMLNASKGSGTGYRLPTEREWEYACRALSTGRFSFGNDDSWLDEFAVHNRTGPRECGLKIPNGWGLFDMHGNVWEWCWDNFGENHYRAIRGGSYRADLEPIRLGAAFRDGDMPSRVYFLIGPRFREDVGFRVCRSQ